MKYGLGKQFFAPSTMKYELKNIFLFVFAVDLSWKGEKKELEAFMLR